MEYFDVIDSREIEKVLQSKKRLYFTGDLKLPQDIQHVFSKDVEIGITHLQEHSYELPHYHTKQHEYCYVMEGSIKYVLPKLNKTYSFQKGDFFHIKPFTIYEQHTADMPCVVFFVKLPSVDDKVELPQTDY